MTNPKKQPVPPSLPKKKNSQCKEVDLNRLLFTVDITTKIIYTKITTTEVSSPNLINLSVVTKHIQNFSNNLKIKLQPTRTTRTM